jgi:hypothetical protein
LLEQFASQAKELVRETTRQSSQDGLLAHVDKVLTLALHHRMFYLHNHAHAVSIIINPT